MSDIITTLHPENDENINLYPNVKKENIPFNSIDYSKLSDDVKTLLNNVGELHPSGVDTSAHILAFSSNKGIYVASDTGHWYYWNGTQYVDGGVFQAVEIANGSITYKKLEINLEQYLGNLVSTTFVVGGLNVGIEQVNLARLRSDYIKSNDSNYMSIIINTNYWYSITEYDADCVT